MPTLETRIRGYADDVLARVAPVSADEARLRSGRRAGRRPAQAVFVAMAATAAVVMAIGAILVAAGLGDDGRDLSTVGQPRSFSLTLDGHRDWMLAFLNAEMTPTDAELEERFTPDFLMAVSPGELRATAAGVIVRGPWRVLREVERRGDQVLAAQLVSSTGEQARLTLHRADGGRLDGATILDAAPCAELGDPDVVVLDQPLAGQLEWVLSLINSDRALHDDEIVARFSPDFLAQVPPEQFRVALSQIRALKPFTLRYYEGALRSTTLGARLGVSSGEEARLALAVEASGDHRITGLLVLTQPPCRLS